MSRFVKAKVIKEELGICSHTLYRWRKEGKIVFDQINSRKIMYDIDSIKRDKKQRKNVIYSRVSNTKQKSDLVKQEQILRDYCVSNGIKIDEAYKDIASGMNENRKDFNKLMDEIIDGNINKIYISYKDRFTRFGFTYFERLLEKFGTTIEVLNSTSEQTYEEELTQDLISIIHHFSMKMYSSRRKQLKEVEKILKRNEDD